ncbi:MAG: hypothetical protein NTU80_04090, partial [Verrucomicrobia bacterium]|nr:hypothetical protein [Verrucomicrobiota bacterium]
LSTTPGAIWDYADGTTPQITWSATQPGVAWLWRSAAGPQLKLDASNTLGLFVPGATTSAITLNPAGTSTFTQGLTVGGVLTASGGLSSPGGIVNGGATGLTLNAGGTNQNITLTPSGTGWTTTGSTLRITNTTASSTTTTGALTVAGGIGVSGQISASQIVANNFRINQLDSSLTNLGLGASNVANFGAINAADSTFTYLAPVFKISHGATGPYLNTPQVVTVAGNFAYVGSSTSTSFQIFDITNPLAPLNRGSLIGNGAPAANLSFPRGIAISGSYAYVTSSTNNALQVINITNPAAPVATAALLDGTGGAALLAPYGIAISGSYAYIASSGSNALQIVNIANPAAPVAAGKLVDATVLSGARAVAVSGNYAYVVSNTGNRFAVVNISNPAAPTLVTSLAHNAAGPLLSGATAIELSGNYAYVTSANSNALQVIDITNPVLPVARGYLVNGTAGALLTTPTALRVVGTTAYITATGGNRGVQVVDVSNPLAPTPKGQLIDGSGNVGLSGQSGIAISGNFAYVASSSGNALQILRLAPGGGFQVKGSTVLTTNAANDVLLGSGQPAAKVAIGTATATARLTVAGTDTAATSSAANFTDSTGKSLLLVRNDGNVGIGTATPTAKLDVAGDARITGIITGNGSGLTNLNAAALTTGKFPLSSIPDGVAGDGLQTGHASWTNNFNAALNRYGFSYVFGSTNSPGAAGNQFYRWTIGLGYEYRNQYAVDFTIGRLSQGGDGYLYTRQQEAGTWGSWSKLKAGQADTVSWAGITGKPATAASFGITDAVTKTASGNVAIGTANATARLTVAGTDTAATSSAASFTDSTGKSLLLVQNDGKVGVGTATPSTKLQIKGGAFQQISAFDNWSGIYLDAASDQPKVGFRVSDNSERFRIAFQGVNTASERLAFVKTLAGENEVLSVLANGNIGIGTSTPTTKLDVAGNLKVSGTASIAGSFTAGGIQDGLDRPSLAISGNYPQLSLISGNIANPNHGPTIMLGSFDNGANSGPHQHWSIGTSGQNSSFLDIGYHSGNNFNPHAGIRNYEGSTFFTIANSGNVGIGTLAPTAKLEVAGNAKVSGTLTVGGQSVVTANQLSNYATTAQVAPYAKPTALYDNSGNAIASVGTDGNFNFANSFTVGSGSTANTYNAIAMGLGANAGSTSIAIGTLVTANGSPSMALGTWTTASGTYSTAMGYGTQATGFAAIALGFGTVANSYGSIVTGNYNIIRPENNPTTWVATDDLFIIGNGRMYDDNGNYNPTRSNAFVVKKNGDTAVSGNLTVAGTTALQGTTTLQGAVAFNTSQPVTGLRVAPAGDIPMLTP